MLLLFIFVIHAISFRLSRLTAKSNLVVANHESNHGPTSIHSPAARFFRLWTPECHPLSGFSTGMSKRFHGVLIQHSARLICTRFGHAIHIQPHSCIDFERSPVGSLTPLTIDMFTPYFSTARVSGGERFIVTR